MVEKTKHALSILQQRSADGASQGAIQAASQTASHENGPGQGTGQGGLSRHTKAAVDDIIARTLQDTEERIGELKRRAGWLQRANLHELGFGETETSACYIIWFR